MVRGRVGAGQACTGGPAWEGPPPGAPTQAEPQTCKNLVTTPREVRLAGESRLCPDPTPQPLKPVASRLSMKSLKAILTAIALSVAFTAPMQAQQKKGGMTPEQTVERVEQAVGSLTQAQKDKIMAIAS